MKLNLIEKKILSLLLNLTDERKTLSHIDYSDGGYKELFRKVARAREPYFTLCARENQHYFL